MLKGRLRGGALGDRPITIRGMIAPEGLKVGHDGGALLYAREGHQAGEVVYTFAGKRGGGLAGHRIDIDGLAIVSLPYKPKQAKP